MNENYSSSQSIKIEKELLEFPSWNNKKDMNFSFISLVSDNKNSH